MIIHHYLTVNDVFAAQVFGALVIALAIRMAAGWCVRAIARRIRRRYR